MDSKTVDELLDLRATEVVKCVLDSLQGSQPNPATNQPDVEIRNIEWIACKDFTISVGRDQIEEYIGTWEVNPRWLCSVEFLQESAVDFARQFHYRALWSMPSRRCPIPRSTACVYFTISISNTQPETSPVLVTFQVESNQTVHTPGKTRFREKWLRDVIESKTLLMETIMF